MRNLWSKFFVMRVTGGTKPGVRGGSDTQTQEDEEAV